MNTPLVLFIYNRPDNVRKIISKIRKVKPKIIFIFADGPKNRKDEIDCDKTILETKKINWTKKIFYIQNTKNVGLKKNIKKGLDIVFKKYTKAIILEDDCMPNSSFFYFAEKLLKIYKNNKKIAGITGNNFNNLAIQDTYYFSQYSSIWGWATWRRVWKTIDVKIKFWNRFKKTKKWKNYFEDENEYKFWTKVFNDVYNGKYNSWAYPYLLSNFYYERFTIVPKKNLVVNVGFGKKATNTLKSEKIYIQKNNKIDTCKIKHPKNIKRNKNADYFDYLYVYGGRSMKFPRNIFSYCKSILINKLRLFNKINSN